MDKNTYDRFIKSFEKSEGCWIWTSHKSSAGYGQFRTRLNGKTRYQAAHRVMAELAFGPIPAGKCVMHSCDTPLCVNHAHLSIGTHKENMDDRDRKGRNIPFDGRGEKNGNCTTTTDIILQIRAAKAAGMKQVEIARSFGFSQPHISQILSGKRWAHLHQT